MQRFILLLCIFLTGCQTSMPLPEVKEPQEITQVSKHADQSPLGFKAVGFDVPRGSAYVTYPYWRWSVPNVNVGFYIANYSMKERMKNSERYWGQGGEPFKSWTTDASDYIETPLKKLGYDVTLSKKSIFNSTYEQMRAEIQLVGSIVDIKMNCIKFYSLLFGEDQNMQAGEIYIKVKWEIYDPLRKKVIDQQYSEGRAQLDEATNSGYDILLLRALENATHNLGRTKAFHDLVTRREKTYPYEETPTQSYLEIETDKKLYTQGIQQDYNFIRRGIVVVRGSLGHGSGFYINDEGYALTNAHVVGDAETVAIVDFSGTQHMADVIRVDKKRDVALIKADISNNSSVPLRLKDDPKMLDKVYAVGAPNKESLKGTVTEGIVSNFRKAYKSGLGYIQASVELAHGNSGGPLLDEFGNVIGIAVEAASPLQQGDTTVYSKFIPIDDALFALNVHIVKPKFP